MVTTIHSHDRVGVRPARSARPRRRCFISYQHAQRDLAFALADDFGGVFLPTALGVTEGADFVNSEDEDYIKRRIRELHLASTTVTIVLIGECTWSRRFIDWEVAASLRDAPRNKRSGLLALSEPGVPGARLPERIGDNWVSGEPDESYAEFRPFPENAAELRDAIDSAFAARTQKAHLADNSRPLRNSDSPCR